MAGKREEGSEPTDAPASDLADRVEALETTLHELQRETMRPPGGPVGLPRPPSPSELLEFTDRHAIPATVAFLNANARAFEALQAALRMFRGVEDATRRSADAGERTAQRGARTLAALESALDDLTTAYREGGLPDDPRARTVLRDAQRLTAEIRDELEATRDTDQNDAGSSTPVPRPRRVDDEEIETELDVLREEYASQDSRDHGDPADETDGDSVDVGGADTDSADTDSAASENVGADGIDTAGDDRE